MSATEQARLCALNNAEWCDSVCRAHGVPGSFDSAMWMQKRKGPPYYSNGITLSPSEEAKQRAAIDQLCSALPEGLSIKDSFACLDLKQAGFRRLFDAEWLWLDRTAAATLPKGSGEWTRVADAGELQRWEAAWALAGSPADIRVFPPSLLLDENIAFLGAKRDGAFVAGFVANRSRGDVVGFSNFFATAEPGRHRPAAVAQALSFGGDRTVVGYQRGDELAGLHALGFRTTGKLRVLVKD